MYLTFRSFTTLSMAVLITPALWWIGTLERSVHSSSLHSAASTGDVQTMVRLVSQGVHCDTRDEFGRTPLVYAAAFNARSVEWLLARRADVNAAQPHGVSALLLAVHRSRCGGRPGDDELVEVLLAAGADPNMRADSGSTPLIYACELGHARAAEALLAAGADVRARDAWGRTALLAAAETGDASLVRTLLDAGAEPDAGDNERTTPLMAAASAGYPDVVQVLLAAPVTRNAERPIRHIEQQTSLKAAWEKRKVRRQR
jgi:ankyrin repeat protein